VHAAMQFVQCSRNKVRTDSLNGPRINQHASYN